MTTNSGNGISPVPGIGRITRALTTWPVFRQALHARYRREFSRPFQGGNRYYGVYSTFPAARAAAEGMTAPNIPAHYDTAAAGRLYRSSLGRMPFNQYPLLCWMQRLVDAGARSVFDLGGNIGLAYYALGPRLGWPEGLRWTVHDMPSVMEVGRKVAAKEDQRGNLSFADDRTDADGHDVLWVAGTLQYLDYELADLLHGLNNPPRHVLVNSTPMHDSDEYYTLQNIGVAICPYRVASRPDFIRRMADAGYVLRDEWIDRERHFEVPFHPGAVVEGYSGGYFERAESGTAQ